MKKGRGYVWCYAAATVTMTILFLGGIIVNKTVTALASDAIQATRTTVIIDAGHGGIDGGAVSCTGVYEAHINLQISLKLQDVFHLLGIQTKMIRTEDISVYTSGESIASKKVSDLKERVRMVNAIDNAILISIHQNYFADSRYSGAQVFYNERDRILATQIQNSFTGLLNRGSKRRPKIAKDIYIMEHIKCPAILIECGFLSNPPEECLLRTDTYQQKVCCVIAANISCYIHNDLTANRMVDIIK